MAKSTKPTPPTKSPAPTKKTEATTTADRVLTIVYESIDEIRRWPRNPKGHDKPMIRASILRYGFVEPIVRDERSGRMAAGHGRTEVLEELRHEGRPKGDWPGWPEGHPAPLGIKVAESSGATVVWQVPVVRGVGFANDTEAEMFLVASNQTVIAGGFDEKALAAIVFHARDKVPDFSPALLGMKSGEVERILASRGDVQIPAQTGDRTPKRGEGGEGGPGMTLTVTCPRCAHTFHPAKG